MKYNLINVTKTFEKLFIAGFSDEKTILNMQLEDLQKLPDLTSIEMNIIIDLKKAIKDKKVISYLNDVATKRGD